MSSRLLSRTITDRIREGAGDVVNFVTDIIEDVVDIAHVIGTAAISMPSWILNTIEHAMRNVPVIGTPLSHFIDGVKSVIEGVTSVLGTALDATIGWVGSMFGRQKITSFPVDPLVFDLDGDGVELLDFQTSNVLFDIDHDGHLERTGWVGSDDGILVHDLNNDGVINSSAEMISEYYGMGENDREPPFRDTTRSTG